MKKIDLSNGIVLLISLLILSLPFLGKTNTIEDANLLDHLFFTRSIWSSVIVIIYFLINYYVFIPHFFLKKKYLIFTFLGFLGLFLTYYIPTLIVSTEEIHAAIKTIYPDKNISSRGKTLIEKVFLDRRTYPYYITFITALILAIRNHLQKIEHQQDKASVAYLKAQINPHFLFNTLNSLYALSLVKSDDAPEAILKLSSIMRYVVTESSNEKVALIHEIKYISDYIDLQKLRLTKNITIEYQVNGLVADQKIAPLLFIPIIENCFKYGVNQKEESVIFIHLLITDNDITLKTSNKKIAKNISELEKTETGISNTRKRLDILYLKKYELKINDTENEYFVYLKINLI